MSYSIHLFNEDPHNKAFREYNHLARHELILLISVAEKFRLGYNIFDSKGRCISDTIQITSQEYLSIL